MTRIVTATLLALTLATPAFAGSAQKKYEAGKKKYFTANFEKPKVYCVCFSDNATNERIGVLREYNPDRATCYFLQFDVDGAIVGESPCTGTFTVVGK